jgi:hypothetical protein
MNITEMDTKCNVYYMHIIEEIIIAFEEEEYMQYDQCISTDNEYTFINIINEYVCGNMSFWTVTPHKPIQRFICNNYNDEDGDIIIDTSHDIIPLTFDHNNNIYTENSQYLCPLMNKTASSSRSFTSVSGNSHLSLSRFSSGSSITDDQLHNLPPLNNVNNLVALVSGDEMDCNQMEVEHAQMCVYAHDAHDAHGLYGNWQPMTRNASMVNNTPHITQQLPPPLPVHTRDNYIHYQPRNPHISQQLPPPPPNNTFVNVPLVLVQHYNHSHSQLQAQHVPPVHVNNF